jgi:hypothetical protein
MKPLLATLFMTGLFLNSAANYANADSFQLNAARVSGHYNCTYSKANGGSLQCATDYSEQKNVDIQMNAKQDGTGYDGSDVITDTNSIFALAIETDSSKNLIAISTLQLAGNNTTADGGLSASTTNTLAVVSLSPLHLQAIDDQSFQITMSFYAYGPASTTNMVTNRNHQELDSYIQAKVKPALSTLIR